MRLGVKCHSLGAMKAARAGDEGVSTEIVGSLDDGLRREILAFIGSLEDERKTFVTTFDDVLRSEVVAVARAGGRIVGLSGVVRRFWVVPFRYNVVLRQFQSRGVATELFYELLPRLNSYFCFFATIMNDNQRVIGLCKRLGYTVIYRGDRFTYLCNGRNPLYNRLVAGAMRSFIPAALALKQTWDRFAHWK